MRELRTWATLLSVVALIAGLPLASALAAGTVAQLLPATQTIAVGATTTVTFHVADVDDLYGFQAEIAFDPAVLAVVDADAGTPGVQVGLGSWLEPDFVFRNDADNSTGIITLALSQLAPSPAVSGSGDLATITFHSLAMGVSSIRFTDLTLANVGSNVIAATHQDAQLAVSDGTPLPTPTPTPAPTGTLLTLRDAGSVGPTVVEVWVEDIAGFHSVDLSLGYDPSILQGVAVEPGAAFTDYPSQCTVSSASIGGGIVDFTATMVCIALDGDLHLATITFDTKDCGTSPLAWIDSQLLNVSGDPIAHTALDSSILPYGCVAGAAGQAFLEGRANHGAIEVTLVDGTSESTQTDADGAYSFGPLYAGTYDLIMSHPLYLPAQVVDCAFESNGVVTLPDVTLLAGDLNGDKVIDISDLALGGANFNTESTVADINGNGYVDIFDIVLIGKNFGATGPVIYECTP
ncbi:MAG: hypothetical protein JXA09_04280 [Anaerolineae bacterium]|nr:hypothetical protein [Anaerolineae bacterium]